MDRGFGNDGWFFLFFKVTVEYLEFWVLDYKVIVIRFVNEKEVNNKRRFFFDKRMILSEGFEDLVRESWERKFCF